MKREKKISCFNLIFLDRDILISLQLYSYATSQKARESLTSSEI